jgi:cob(I)alamin adenosyltransferase
LFVLTAVFAVAFAPLASPVVARAAAKDDEDEKDDDAKKGAATLGAVGGLSVISANSTILLIGVTADAFAKDVYKPEQVRAIMKPIIKQLDAVSNLLRKVQEAGLSEQDDDYVDQIIEMYRLLQDEARALDKFVIKKGESEAKAFEKARQAAVKALGKLTGEDKDEDEEKEEEK